MRTDAVFKRQAFSLGNRLCIDARFYAFLLGRNTHSHCPIESSLRNRRGNGDLDFSELIESPHYSHLGDMIASMLAMAHGDHASRDPSLLKAAIEYLYIRSILPDIFMDILAILNAKNRVDASFFYLRLGGGHLLVTIQFDQ